MHLNIQICPQLGTLLISGNKTAQASNNSFNQSQLSDFKESAVDANIAAKKAVIESIMRNAGKMQTNKERLQPAREMLNLQKNLVQNLIDAINSNQLSTEAKLKYLAIIENEKSTVRQYENLVHITEEAANHGL